MVEVIIQVCIQSYWGSDEWSWTRPPQEIPIHTPRKVSSPQKILYQRTWSQCKETNHFRVVETTHYFEEQWDLLFGCKEAIIWFYVASKDEQITSWTWWCAFTGVPYYSSGTLKILAASRRWWMRAYASMPVVLSEPQLGRIWCWPSGPVVKWYSMGPLGLL